MSQLHKALAPHIIKMLYSIIYNVEKQYPKTAINFTRLRKDIHNETQRQIEDLISFSRDVSLLSILEACLEYQKDVFSREYLDVVRRKIVLIHNQMLYDYIIAFFNGCEALKFQKHLLQYVTISCLDTYLTQRFKVCPLHAVSQLMPWAFTQEKAAFWRPLNCFINLMVSPKIIENCISMYDEKYTYHYQKNIIK
jgi:hypothetical protein